MKTKIRHSRKGFTLIELLVGMTIFSVGITSIFLLLQQTMKSASISKNEIVVSNLLREQLELVRNQRDTNYKNYAKWGEGIEVWNVIVENNFSVSSANYDENNKQFSVTIEKKDNLQDTTEKNISENEKNSRIKNNFEHSQLCRNDDNLFVHCANDADKKNSGTIFASYSIISRLKFDWQPIEIEQENEPQKNELQWYMIDARVIVRDGNNYREYDAKTILTDWKQ